MKHYEIMYIIPIQADVEETVVQDKVRQMLVAEGAKITLEEPMGKRKLAYPIKHVRHGAYVVLECELDPLKVKAVNDWFRLSAEVLRAQIIAKQVKTPERLAREKALQEKLARLHAKAEAEINKPEEPVKSERPKIRLDELDQKLEQILEEEIVK